MDFADIKEILTTVAAILVTVLFGYLSDRKKKPKQRTVRPAASRREGSGVSTQSITPPPVSVSRIPETLPVESEALFVEGERVTLDSPAENKVAEETMQKNLKLDELRRAVVWSEILTPKFNRY